MRKGEALTCNDSPKKHSVEGGRNKAIVFRSFLKWTVTQEPNLSTPTSYSLLLLISTFFYMFLLFVLFFSND